MFLFDRALATSRSPGRAKQILLIPLKCRASVLIFLLDHCFQEYVVGIETASMEYLAEEEVPRRRTVPFRQEHRAWRSPAIA